MNLETTDISNIALDYYINENIYIYLEVIFLRRRSLLLFHSRLKIGIAI